MRIYLPIVLTLAAGVSCAQRGHTSGLQPRSVPQPVFEQQIRNAVDAGDGDYALRQLRDRMAAEPENVQVRLDLAEAYRRRGFPEVALEHCRLAAARFPDSAPVALALAKSLRVAGRQQEAARSLDVFLTGHPQAKTPELISWLGIVRDELGLWTEGEKAHREAVGLSPASAYLHNNLGYNLLRQDRKEAAAVEFRKALELDPQSALARNNLALALASTSEQALNEWKRLYDPATAHSNLAAALIEEGRYVEARRELEVALGYNQFHPAALRNLKLISELDGKPAGIPAQDTEARWARWKAALRSLFVGPLPAGDSKPAAPAVSSNNGRGL
jgi:tetratricopeptide (TPR) repeat protein